MPKIFKVYRTLVYATEEFSTKDEAMAYLIAEKKPISEFTICSLKDEVQEIIYGGEND